MAKKNKKATTNTTNLPALRIGTRIRCTEDGVEGRIVWANGLMVKIEWTDGEKVTWRRDSLASKPIEIIDDEADQTAAPAAAVQVSAGANEPDQPAPAAEETTAAIALDQRAPAAAETTATAEQPPTELEATPAPAEPATTAPATSEPQAPTSEPTASEPTAPASEVPVEQTAPGTPDATAATAAKPKRQRKTAAEPKVKKPSALDAAAKVLADAGKPLSCQEMIDRMAATGLWRSPGGRTPSATLYSAILRELATKGNNSRFAKVGRGQFAYHAQE